MRCAEGQALLNSALHTREEVIPSGIPQTEDRALESLRQDWQAYQQRLLETRTQFNNVVNKLRLVEQKFQQVDEWLKTMEEKVSLRTARQSSRAARGLLPPPLQICKDPAQGSQGCCHRLPQT